MADAFEIPGTQSQKAMDALSSRFPEFAGASGQVVVSAPAGSKVTDPAVTARIEDLTARYAALPHVSGATSPFNELVKGTVAPDGSAAIIAVQLDLASDDVTDATRHEPLIALAHEATAAGLTTSVGGALFTPTAPEMSITEGLGVVVALIVLVVTLGSAIAAGIPLLTSLLGVAMSMSFILIATHFTTITSTAPFLALMIGLAVGIDYALFILSRHRDLLAEGVEVEEAAAWATGTAGSAVVFAAPPSPSRCWPSASPRSRSCRSWASLRRSVSGVRSSSPSPSPALIGAAGTRLTPKRVADAHHARRHTSWSASWVRLVTKVPALTAILVIGGLGVAALPARDLTLALPNNGDVSPRVDPAGGVRHGGARLRAGCQRAARHHPRHRRDDRPTRSRRRHREDGSGHARDRLDERRHPEPRRRHWRDRRDS